MEKINIYVPENVGAIIEYDASMFEVYKKDGKTINKNKFLSLLITGYHEDYVSDSRAAYEKIINAINLGRMSNKEKERIAKDILDRVVLPIVPSRKGKNPAKFSIKPTKDTEALIEHILLDLEGDRYISQYLCRMFMSYCKMPFSKREKIIFRGNYEAILKACSDKKSISFNTIWNRKRIHEVIPYKIVVGSEEMFNYLLCAEINADTGKQEAKAYRLNRIDRIYSGRSICTIDGVIQNYLEMMIQRGPQYEINDDEETCVKLTDAGLKSFSRIYYGRPKVDRIEKKEDYSLYYFMGSKDQVFLYFRRFRGNEAVIVSPQWLRNKMARFHKESYIAYSAL